jgi:hypothetical protein
MKKFSLLALLILIALLGLSGCEEEDTSGAMAGTWTLDSVETSAGADRMLGGGNFTLTYVTTSHDLGTVEYYTGSGTFQAYTYNVDALYLVDFQWVWIKAYEDGEDLNTDSINLEDISYSGGDNMDGDYYGEGVYEFGGGGGKDIGEGTFTATR